MLFILTRQNSTTFSLKTKTKKKKTFKIESRVDGGSRPGGGMCVACVCVRACVCESACVRACVRVCVCACAEGGGITKCLSNAFTEPFTFNPLTTRHACRADS